MKELQMALMILELLMDFFKEMQFLKEMLTKVQEEGRSELTEEEWAEIYARLDDAEDERRAALERLRQRTLTDDGE